MSKLEKKAGEEGATDSRRGFLLKGGTLAVAAGLGAAPALGDTGSAPPFETQVFPKYFPRGDHVTEVSVAGKFVVVTGASRGIGRATAEALADRGAIVVGTSRDAANAPNPPSYPLLDLDITSQASVDDFAAALAAHEDFPGSIDILVNNAGRYVLGTPVPPPIAPDPAGFFQAAAELGVETVYAGHVRVTNKLLPLMTSSGYARILFTVSVAGYSVGGSDLGEQNGQSFANVYYSSKRALLCYANNLRGFLGISGSNIKVCTVNPYFVNTALLDGLRPIYTEPVDGNGNSPYNPYLQQVIDGGRLILQNALPASLVGEAFAQLAEMDDPVPNVIASSPDEPLATAGGNALIETVGLLENDDGALSYGAQPPGQS